MSIVAGALCVGDIGYLAAETTRSGATVAVGYAKQAAAALIAIDNANQRLFGTTAAAVGTYNVTLRADSPAGVFGTRALSIVVT